MNKLREYRKSRHLYQHSLADLTGVNQSDISHIEAHNDLPSPRTAKALAAHFGVKVEAMFPDGVKPPTKTSVTAAQFIPPLPPATQYPRRDFAVVCGHCRQTLTMRADDYHGVTGQDLSCPSCGAVFYAILPLEEAQSV